MNKTYTINISGIVFNIDDNAYQLLNEYLDEIKNHFGNDEDRKEIIDDIESRIAEIFSEKITSNRQVITLKDVEEIIETLGKASDFDSEGEETEESHGTQQESKFQHHKYDQQKKRKLYRDVEDNMLGGVAKGLSYYFGMDVTLIRIIFVILMLSGTAGFWIYIILWAVTPEAKSSIEKLEMKGEPINLSNLEKTIKDEFQNVSESIKNKKLSRKINIVFDKFVKLVVAVINAIWSVVKYIFGSVFILVGIILLTVLVSFFIFDQQVFSFSKDTWVNLPIQDVMPMITSVENGNYLLLSLLGLIAIPVISLLFSGIKILLGIKTNTKVFSLMFLILWIFLLITFALASANVAKEFQHKKSQPEKFVFGQNLYINVQDNQMPSDSIFFTDYDEFVVLSKSQIQIRPDFEYHMSNDSLFKVRIIKKAFGITRKQAMERVEAFEYEYSQANDTLHINRYLNTQSKYRGEHVIIQIFRPEGKEVETNVNYIYDGSYHYHRNRYDSWDDEYRWDSWD